jgi:FlaA1/EpsC-like NDP-sugar epimerase
MTEFPPDNAVEDANGHSLGGRLHDFALRHRVLVSALVHATLFSLALFVSYLVRFEITADKDPWFTRRFLALLPVYVGIKLVIFDRLKLLRGGWTYASIRDVMLILLASWLFVLVMYVCVVLFRDIPDHLGRQLPVLKPLFRRHSHGILVLDFMATVLLVCAARLGFRIYREEMRPVAPGGARRVLIVGAGNAGEAIVREIFRMREQRYSVVGLVDDDPAKRGIYIHGLPVLGTTADIRTICQDEDVEEIIIAMPSATQKQLRRVIDLCSGTKLRFQSLPGVGDLIDRRVTVSQIRPVDINDLLGREAIELDMASIARFLNNRRVLITGAGGSIGSEMCRQVCNFGPVELILVEQAETPLFDIENELRATFPGIAVLARICDVYDRRRVMQIWREKAPEVVIHAAAHKHVPMMERNPAEAVKNNVIGTKNVADASCACGVAEFVLISTDKAVNPSSIMGASKRMAEMYTQSLNGHGDCRTQFKAVRFGNVLGSAGSVIPTFRRQIAKGGPVTVTDPRMTRYFMTIPEASQLVLQAAATGAGGQIFLLNMGEPVKIVDLARQMITLSGFRPDEDIDIVFSGVRPGEKLFEELRTEGEDVEPTVHPKVLVWKHNAADWRTVEGWMDELTSLADCLDRDKIAATFKKIIPEYEPPEPINFQAAGGAAATAPRN